MTPKVMISNNITANRVIFVHENIHKLIFHVNKFSWVPGIHENIVTWKFCYAEIITIVLLIDY